MERAVLEVVASKAVASAQDMKRYVQCTLLAATQNFEVRLLDSSIFLGIQQSCCNYQYCSLLNEVTLGSCQLCRS